jgi:phosphoribosylglycinamide formyltransferase-1
MNILRIAVLGSTRGTVLQNLIDAVAKGHLAINIKLVISDKKDAYILERARLHHIPTDFIDPKDLSRRAYDEKIHCLLKQHSIDFILLIGYMRILSPIFVQEWKNKIINVHPSLLPKHAGLMGDHVHRAVLESGEQNTGCTIHYVTEEVDAGPILLQKSCRVDPHDTIASLKAKVQALEGQAYIEAIEQIIVAQSHKESIT